MNENNKQKTISEKEQEILNFWQENKIFEKSIETPAGEKAKGDFSFYDGPPFATGLPHFGHILAGTIKDAIPRYQTMNGKSVRRKWGWDCHGLPIENLIEKVTPPSPTEKLPDTNPVNKTNPFKNLKTNPFE